MSYREFTKEQKYQIEKTNKYFFHKLEKTTSCLNSQKWKEDFKQSRKLKRNICTFPTINFQKTGQIKLEREKSFNENIQIQLLIFIIINLIKLTLKRLIFISLKKIKMIIKMI